MVAAAGEAIPADGQVGSGAAEVGDLESQPGLKPVEQAVGIFIAQCLERQAEELVRVDIGIGGGG